jgi:hypothetical protein
VLILESERISARFYKRVIIAYLVFFTASFGGGAVYGRHQLQTEERGIYPDILRGISYRITGTSVELSFSCPGSEVLWRYGVGSTVSFPDNGAISRYLRDSDLSLAKFQVPDVTVAAISGLIGALGGHEIYVAFKGGMLRHTEWAAVAGGLLIGFPVGWYVTHEMIPPGCPSEKILKAMASLNWLDVADKEFGYEYDHQGRICRFDNPLEDRQTRGVTCGSAGGSPEDVIYRKVRCSKGHVTEEDFLWLRREWIACEERRQRSMEPWKRIGQLNVHYSPVGMYDDRPSLKE